MKYLAVSRSCGCDSEIPGRACRAGRPQAPRCLPADGGTGKRSGFPAILRTGLPSSQTSPPSPDTSFATAAGRLWAAIPWNCTKAGTQHKNVPPSGPAALRLLQEEWLGSGQGGGGCQPAVLCVSSGFIAVPVSAGTCGDVAAVQRCPAPLPCTTGVRELCCWHLSHDLPKAKGEGLSAAARKIRWQLQRSLKCAGWQRVSQLP